MSQQTVTNDVKVDIAGSDLTEPLLREAAACLPEGHGLDVDDLIEQILYADEEAPSSSGTTVQPRTERTWRDR